MIVFMTVMVAIISGCAVKADAAVDISYPSLELALEIVDKEPYRFEIEEEVKLLEEPGVETRDGVAPVSGGANWLYAKVQDGEQGTETVRYMLAYNRNGDLLSRVEVPEKTEIVPTTPTIYSNGQVAKTGAYFSSSRVTRYGYDCSGCYQSNNRGSTSAGIQVGYNEVRQHDGSWQQGITYEGYYIIATSQSIPLCTIVEVSNHTISGYGLTPGVPFKAIVLDRGGSIIDSKIDLFIGSESDSTVKLGSKRTFDVKILEMNLRTRENGTWNCDV